MLKTVSLLLYASILSLLPQSPLHGVAAAEKSSQVTSAAQPTAKAMEYARRYLVAIRMEETVRLVMDSLGPALIDGETARRPGMTATDKQVILEAVTESMVTAMPRFSELYAAELAGILTEDELRQLAEFYESPVGRAVTAKTKAMSQAAERAMMKLLPEITDDMEQRLCRRIDCDSARTAGTRTS